MICMRASIRPMPKAMLAGSKKNWTPNATEVLPEFPRCELINWFSTILLRDLIKILSYYSYENDIIHKILDKKSLFSNF